MRLSLWITFDTETLMDPSTRIPLIDSNRAVVISTVAQRNGEIYLDRFSFAEHLRGSRLPCTPLERTAPQED